MNTKTPGEQAAMEKAQDDYEEAIRYDVTDIAEFEAGWNAASVYHAAQFAELTKNVVQVGISNLEMCEIFWNSGTEHYTIHVDDVLAGTAPTLLEALSKLHQIAAQSGGGEDKG